MVRSSIPKIVLGGLFGGLMATASLARAADPEVEPPAGSPAPVVSREDPVSVDVAPGLDLPPQVAAQVRAVIEDALAGRPPPGVPIQVTLEAGGAVVRVGSLSRRVAVGQWDYTSMRTVALHVLDLLQPAPEAPEVLPANSAAVAPAAPEIADLRASARLPETADEPAGPFSLHASIAGARGAQGADPWVVSLSVGAAWTHDWLRIGLEAGWDHGLVRHLDGSTVGQTVTVNYDATPLRLVFAAQNKVVMAGFRTGIAGYRVTTERTAYWELTPLIGPFLAARFPVAGRVRGLLVGGFDYFGRRTELSTGAFDTVYSTPQLAPYVGVVLEAVLGS
jgi:hypothetical protein